MPKIRISIKVKHIEIENKDVLQRVAAAIKEIETVLLSDGVEYELKIKVTDNFFKMNAIKSLKDVASHLEQWTPFNKEGKSTNGFA